MKNAAFLSGFNGGNIRRHKTKTTLNSIMTRSRNSNMPFAETPGLQEDKPSGADIFQFGITRVETVSEKIERHPHYLMRRVPDRDAFHIHEAARRSALANYERQQFAQVIHTCSEQH